MAEALRGYEPAFFCRQEIFLNLSEECREMPLPCSASWPKYSNQPRTLSRSLSSRKSNCTPTTQLWSSVESRADTTRPAGPHSGGDRDVPPAEAQAKVALHRRGGLIGERASSIGDASHLEHRQKIASDRNGDLEADGELDLVPEKHAADIPSFEPVTPTEHRTHTGTEHVEVGDGLKLSGRAAFRAK